MTPYSNEFLALCRDGAKQIADIISYDVQSLHGAKFNYNPTLWRDVATLEGKRVGDESGQWKFTYNKRVGWYYRTADDPTPHTFGFNQWDENSSLGFYDIVGNNVDRFPSTSRIRSASRVPVLPNTTYCVSMQQDYSLEPDQPEYSISDNAHYLMRQTAGGATVGNHSVIDKLVGGTMVWNQQLKIGTFTTESGVTASYTEGMLQITSNTANNGVVFSNTNIIRSHKYFITISAQALSNLDVKVNIGGGILSRFNLTSSITTNSSILSANVNNTPVLLYPTSVGSFTTYKLCIIDLTQMFDATIADYIYSLERAHAGDGVAFVKSFIENADKSYHAGKLVSVKTSAHVTKDANAVTLGTYPVDNIDLRGKLKLDANNKLYYDGDEYASDGTVTRKYGIVNLGTLTWLYRSAQGVFSLGAGRGFSKTRGNVICAIYPQYTGGIANMPDMTVATFSSFNANDIVIKNSNYTNAAAFKAAMSGVYLVYELATPTTETATPITNPQQIDPNGTESFVDARSVPMPVQTYARYEAALNGVVLGVFELSTGSDGTYPTTGKRITPITTTARYNTFKTSPTTGYVVFSLNDAYGTTYNDDICINISSSRDGEYAPYVNDTFRSDLDTFGISRADSVPLAEGDSVTVTVITDRDIMMTTNPMSVNRTCRNTSKLSFGTAICAELNMTLMNYTGRFNNIDFIGKEMYASVAVTSAPRSQKLFWYVPLGVFIADKQTFNNNGTVTIHALDRLVKFDRPAIQYTSGETVETVLTAILNIGLVPLATDTIQNIRNAPNSQVQIGSFNQNGYTLRQQMCAMLELLGLSAYCDADGALSVQNMRPKSFTINSSDRFITAQSKHDRNAVSYTGVKIRDINGTEYLAGTDEYPYEIVNNNVIMGDYQGIAGFLWAVYVGQISIYPTDEACVPMPMLFPLDRVNIVYPDRTDQVLLTDVTYVLNGRTTIRSETESVQVNLADKFNPFTAEQASYLQAMENKIAALQDKDELVFLPQSNWSFNNSISWTGTSGTKTTKVMFISGAHVPFTEITLISGSQIKYGATVVYTGGAWQNTSYKVFDVFKDAYVTKEFSNWLSTNATRIS